MVVMLSKSHLRGCTTTLNNYLGDKFRTIDWNKPGASIEELLDNPRVAPVNLKKCNVIVLLLMIYIEIILRQH
jgi:hypothetical protein